MVGSLGPSMQEMVQCLELSHRKKKQKHAEQQARLQRLVAQRFARWFSRDIHDDSLIEQIPCTRATAICASDLQQIKLCRGSLKTPWAIHVSKGQTDQMLQGARMGLGCSRWLASASPITISAFGSHFSLRPRSIATTAR